MLVLEETDGISTVLSREVIEVRDFSVGPLSGRGWGRSDLRYWLNTTFLRYAFHSGEIARIVPTNLGNQLGNRPVSASATRLADVRRMADEVLESRDMVDYAFCLDKCETERLLPGRAAAQASPYAAAFIGAKRAAAWWLRDVDGNGAGFVDSSRAVVCSGESGIRGVRPAMRIRRTSDQQGDLELGASWCSETPGKVESILVDVALGAIEKYDYKGSIISAFSDGDNRAVALALEYGDYDAARSLLLNGRNMPSFACPLGNVVMGWVGCATTAKLIGEGLIDPEAYEANVEEILRRKPYSFIAEFYPDKAIENWSKIKTSPRAVKMLVPHVDSETFKQKAALIKILSENGFTEELKVLNAKGGFLTRKSISTAREIALSSGHEDTAEYLCELLGECPGD